METAPHISDRRRDTRRLTNALPYRPADGEKSATAGKGLPEHAKAKWTLRKLNWPIQSGRSASAVPMLNTAIDAAEMILTLAPETNGQVAVKAWRR
ncbi:hypothetical protein KCP69_16985 [Salmonella enterica subsp. enterica]|nr:hypothetical protein KCP69_16985 [Salmonella enterica subsp. enterica]